MTKEVINYQFIKELSGDFGPEIQAQAVSKMESFVAEVNEKAVVEEDGSIRWKTNGEYLEDDDCEKLQFAGYKFDREATREKKKAQDREFLLSVAPEGVVPIFMM